MKQYNVSILAAASVILVLTPLHAQVPVTSGLTLWLKADAGVQTNASGVVTNWIDQSGNGNDARKEPTDPAPSLVTNGINGLPSLLFSGSLDYLQATNTSLNITGDLTLIAVVRATSYTSERAVLGNYSGGFGYYLADTTSDTYQFFAGASAIGGNSTNDLNKPVILSGVNSGSAVTLYDNAFQIATAAAGATTASGFNYVHIGRVNGVGGRFAGYMSEILIYDQGLSNADRFWVENYLADKYGLSIPEPGVAAMVGVAGLALFWARRRG